jgi:DNA processing protein
MDHLTTLVLALAATRSAADRRLRVRVRRDDPEALTDLIEEMESSQRESLHRRAEELRTRNIGALLPGLDPYPQHLMRATETPPVLFYSGPLDLLQSPAVGICGSRNAGPDGLRAATACGEIAAQHGVVSVSGYARGVDRATHVASLEHGGSTIVVLPEGIDHFKILRGDVAAAWDPNRALVLSQFAPTQTWSAGAAMARNSVIIGLSRALVVVEAGETGGTLAAGTRALRLGHRVLALEFASTPAGNKVLLNRGAVSVRDRSELSLFIHDLVHVAPEQETRDLKAGEQYVLAVDGSAEQNSW